MQSLKDKSKATLLVLFFSFLSLNVESALEDYLPKDVGPTSSRYGGIGLIELPTARFAKEGNLRLGISSSWPYEVTAMMATPFPWMEAVYRYTEIKNELYSDIAAFSRNQTLKDKGFDVRFRILQESKYIPELAIGLRDLAGTGLFSGEYIVATKRLWDLDTTLGLGWGSLAGKTHFSNPLIKVSEEFRTRTGEFGAGGEFSYDDWFSGSKVSIFGGFEYSLPYRGWRLKAEYDTSSIAEEPWITSPINYSIATGNDSLEYSFGYKGRDNFFFSFFLKGDFGTGTGSIVPKIDPPISLTPPSEKDKNRLARDRELLFGSINANLAVARIYTQGASIKGNELILTINQAKFRSQPRAIGRSIRVASLLAPDFIEYITINSMNADVELTSVTVRRKDFSNAINSMGSTAEIYRTAQISSPNQHWRSADFKPRVNFPEIRTNIAPAVRNMIGGPEAFYLGQLWIRINNTIKFRRGLELNTVIGLNLWQNFNELRTPSDSVLPHVRSDIQEYLKEGKNNIMRMKLDYIFSPYKDIYARFDIGLLEEMFGGIGGEVLYRPFARTWAVGLALHRVKQRDYKQKFGFLDGPETSVGTRGMAYETETGHLEIYKEFPTKGVIAQVMAGKFLAGDKGVTLDVSRRFRTGLRLGFFFTRTDATAEEFGEGSFDKGIYFQIPHDLFFTNYSTGQVFFGIHPMTRDGGALLVQHHSLYSISGNTAKYEIERDWDDIVD